jgi:hypothetical protein
VLEEEEETTASSPFGSMTQSNVIIIFFSSSSSSPSSSSSYSSQTATWVLSRGKNLASTQPTKLESKLVHRKACLLCMPALRPVRV